MRLSRPLAVLVALLLFAGGAAAGKPAETGKDHPKHGATEPPAPTPAPVAEPPAAPAPGPVPTSDSAPASTPAPEEPAPEAITEPPAGPETAVPEPASQPAREPTSAWAEPTSRDPIFLTVGAPGPRAEGAPMVAAASLAPLPQGSFPWGFAVVGLLALGAVVLVGARPLAPKPIPRAAPSVRLHVASAEDVGSLLRAGEAAVKAGRHEEAVAWFTQAIAMDPTLHVAHFCRGVCLASLGRHAEARDAFRKAHRLDPAEGAYRLELARASARTGCGPEAMEALAPLLAALPELAQDVAEDEAFAGLRDHPRFLALVGLL